MHNIHYAKLYFYYFANIYAFLTFSNSKCKCPIRTANKHWLTYWKKHILNHRICFSVAIDTTFIRTIYYRQMIKMVQHLYDFIHSKIQQMIQKELKSTPLVYIYDLCHMILYLIYWWHRVFFMSGSFVCMFFAEFLACFGKHFFWWQFFVFPSSFFSDNFNIMRNRCIVVRFIIWKKFYFLQLLK